MKRRDRERSIGRIQLQIFPCIFSLSLCLSFFSSDPFGGFLSLGPILSSPLILSYPILSYPLLSFYPILSYPLLSFSPILSYPLLSFSPLLSFKKIPLRILSKRLPRPYVRPVGDTLSSFPPLGKRKGKMMAR